MFKKRPFIFLLFLFCALFSLGEDTLSNPFLTALEKIEKGDRTYFDKISKSKDAGNNFAFYLCKATLYAEENKNIAAFTLYKKAIEIAQTNKDKAIANLKTGTYFSKNDLLVQALQYLNKAELLYSFNENEPGFIELNKQIGMVNSYLGSREKAIDRFLKIYNVSKTGINYKLTASAANNIGVNYIELSNYEEAEKFLNISLNIRMKINDKFWMGQNYNNFGTLYFKKGDYDKAAQCFNKGYLLRKNFGDNPDAVTESEINLGKTYLKLNKMDLAESMLNTAFEKGKETKQMAIISRAAFYLKDIYFAKKDFKKAFEMQNEVQLAQDSLYGLEKRSEINKMNLETEFKSKMLNDSINIINQENQLQIKTAQNKQSKTILIALIVFLGFTLFMIINLFKQNKKKNAANILISSQANILKEQNVEIKDSINYARNLQVSLLPSETLFKNNLEDHFILFLPKDIVSGDFYWSTTVIPGSEFLVPGSGGADKKHETANKELFYLALGDCTGHGVPGSMVSILGITALNRCISEFKLSEPKEILEKLSEIITESFSHDDKQLNDGMDISLCSIEFYENHNGNYSGKLKWAGANNPLHVIRDDKPIEFKGTRRPIGAYTQFIVFEQQELELIKGDVVYLYTDGFYDQFGGAEGKKFKQKSLKDLLLKIHKLPLSEQKEQLLITFKDWKTKHEQIDDVSVIGFRV